MSRIRTYSFMETRQTLLHPGVGKLFVQGCGGWRDESDMDPRGSWVERTDETGNHIGNIRGRGCSPLKGLLTQHGLREFTGSSACFF